METEIYPIFPYPPTFVPNQSVDDSIQKIQWTIFKFEKLENSKEWGTWTLLYLGAPRDVVFGEVGQNKVDTPPSSGKS